MRPVTLLLACLVVQLSAIALGADTELDTLPTENVPVHPQPAANAPSTRPDSGARARFGIALVCGPTLADTGGASNVLGGVIGLELRLGVQLGDLFAVLLQGSAGLLDLRAAALFEVTPTRYFSAGVGVGVDFMPAAFGAPPPLPETHAWIVPARLAFNLPLSAYATENRSAISFEVNLVPGSVSDGRPADLGQPFEFGIIGGLGFELY